MDDGWRKVEAGACGAWPLPVDATSAGVARRLFRRTASALALDAEAIDDGETIVSELAANTLHAEADLGAKPGPWGPDGSAVPGCPELWLYLRGWGERCELVCKVFDACPGWAPRGTPGQRGRRVPAEAMSGRGLEVVHELSQGRWGYHLTRARTGSWSIRGKAVWFATPAPGARKSLLAGGGASVGLIPASAALTQVEAELVARGLSEAVAREDDPATDTAVLSVCGEFTVWCRAGCAWLRAPGLDSHAWGYGDLVEVAEQAVAAYATYCSEPGGRASGEPAHAGSTACQPR